MGRIITKILTDNEIVRMRAETITLLERIGVKVNHDGAKRMLKKNGATVDDHANDVLIPRELCEECLKLVPRKVNYGGRTDADDTVAKMANDFVITRSYSGAEHYIDLNNNEIRKARISDVKDWYLLVYALDNIMQCATPYYYDEKSNLKARDVVAFERLLENTTKPIVLQTYGPTNLEYCIHLASIERGGKDKLIKHPRFTIHISPIPPLNYYGNTIDQMFLAGKYNVPVEIATVPFCGVSAPVTIAGGMIMALAEHLAGVVIHQLANPGAPIVFAPRVLHIDMLSGNGLQGAVESALASAGLSQVARDGFGWIINTLPSTESFSVDGQSIMERCFGIILAGCSWTNTMSGAGHIETGNTLDPVQLVIDNEIYGMMFRGLKGIEVNNDTLGLDVIKKVGIGEGKSFISEAHTLKHFRSEIFRPKILTRASREMWASEGRKDLYERARERAILLLKKHSVPKLDESVIKDMRLLVTKAEEEIAEVTTE